MCDPTQAGDTATLHQKFCRMTGGIPCKAVHGLSALFARAFSRSPEPHAGCSGHAPSGAQSDGASGAHGCGCGGHAHAKAGACGGEHQASHAGEGCCGGGKGHQGGTGKGACGCGGKAAHSAESGTPQR
ncbi:hypothetical protein OPU71_00895 [Niveibacterium sp. 24ML]|uniref:hypothetical protein n=1 Tax=Niveibacterium sp. 24ML TaxID=2985512 RepID=UPI0022700590|nr:hypothetical protein [Niveibacterium sp. 24ML]MCX9154675.1 hypothetical protein [Niveibacterium sp. 24ML]